MINAKELRIGNWVTYHGETDMPCQLDAQDIFNIATGYMDNDKIHSPIPLTPEILEKCGFTVASDKEYGGWITPFYGIFKDNAFRIRVNACGEFYYSPDKYANPIYLRFLHHLQNWFFALTGEELEYTP